MNRQSLITLGAVFWMIMIAVLLLTDANSRPVAAQMSDSQTAARQNSLVDTTRKPKPTLAPTPALPADPSVVVAPYPVYTVTQGPHGFSYGQMAIDLTAGKGATIHSPINGTVTQLFTDYLGNPTLIIDNDFYQVTLMHGDYTVAVGQVLRAGDPVGTESNNGNTVDWWGQSCRGRDCGYHSHLNIFDKRIGSNVNPLELIPPSQ